MKDTITIGAYTWSDGTSVPHVRDIRLDPSGQIEMARGIDAYRVIVESVVLTLRGEMLLDAERGVDYENTVFVSSRRLGAWKAQVIRSVEELTFVRRVESLDASVNAEGHVRFVLKVQTDDGELTIEQEV